MEPMARPRRNATRARLVGVTLGLAATLAPAGWAAARGNDDGNVARVFSVDTVAPTTTVSPTDTYVYDLENEPSQCIGFLPKPDCGKKPEQAGDRGGPLQWATFGVILVGVGVIGAVVARNVIRRDRAIADDLRTKGL